MNVNEWHPCNSFFKNLFTSPEIPLQPLLGLVAGSKKKVEMESAAVECSLLS